MAQRKKIRALGCAPSTMDGSEHIYNNIESLSLPEEYSYVEFMSKILDQGVEPICVPCSISAYINWKINMKEGKTDDYRVNLKQIFNNAGGNSRGMTFKNALSYVRHNGVDTTIGKVKIQEYALVRNVNALKNAIIANGPCVGGLPVYDDTGVPNFWDERGLMFKGGHAISIVGWNKEGFIIRNSWGRYFGEKGYAVLPYNQFDLFFEVWTIVR